MTLELGARLGHYRILALLGRGGMADVYRAEDEHLGREVALKGLPPEFARDPGRVERFEREVRAVANLNHANIVTVYEFGQGEGQHFFTMELMPGGDLKARIRAHPEGMPPLEARSVASAMARALDYAHRRDFVHRDVKPENILFGEDGTPKLSDFGIARAMSEGARMTATGMSIGSPHYMSPEQARGLKVDGRSDLYSLGVVLYEMLTGRLPFDAADTFAVGLSHINDPVPALPGEIADWQPVLDRLLAKSPQDRYGSAGELAEVLGAEASPRVRATRVVPRVRQVGSTRQAKESKTRLAAGSRPRRGRLLALAGSLLVLAALGIGYLALRETKESVRLTSSGAGGGAAVRPDALRPEAPSKPARVFNLDPTESASPELRVNPARVPVQPAPLGPSPKTSVAAQKPARAEPLPVLGGKALLVVETTPAGVEVLVDGEPVGKTPLERADIGAGVREVRLRHPHYRTVREAGRRFEDGRVVRIRRALVRGRGALTVTATPREAWVEVDGKRLAEGTPVTLEDLPAGAVVVELGAAEHRPLSVEVEIPQNGRARLERSLERIPHGSLTLELEPPDARVTLPHPGRRYRPGVRLPEGSHRVVVRADGYRKAVRTVLVSGATRVRIALKREARVFDGIEFVWIPPGEFRMGSSSRHALDNERPVTRVRISRGFWFGKYEVTQRQWQSVMRSNPSGFRNCGGDCPVESVSWKDVQAFVGKLNEREGERKYRLPTEAEWEYAARAGTDTDTHAGDLTEPQGTDPVVDRVAWYGKNSGGRTHPVGGKAANQFGLHDMVGNVWEWVGDRYGEYPGGSLTDPAGRGSDRVRRGGSWYNSAKYCRSANRYGDSPTDRYNTLGFRLLRVK